MGAIFTNNATSTLAAGISPASASFTVQPGHGERFPTLAKGEWFPVTIVKSATELEIVQCTARSGDTLTIERAQEGTTALSFDAGDIVEHRLTAEVLNGLIDDVEGIAVPEPLPSLYRFDAVDGLPLPAGMTFARASGGYALNRQGYLKWYGVNAPRHAYKPDGSYRGILVEGANTNQFTRSQELEHTDWSKGASTITTNFEIAPDGTATAERLTPTATTSGHSVSRSMAYTAGVTVCISAYLKISGYSGIVIHAPNTAFDAVSSPRAWFNLTTGGMAGTGGFAGDAGIEYLADGWARVWATFTPTVTISGPTVFYVMPTGSELSSTGYEANGTDGMFLWGLQFEESVHPSSYIPTAATTVARAADNWAARVAALNGWSNNPYSMFVDADADASYARNAILSLRGSSAARGASLQMQQVGSDVDIGLRHRGDIVSTPIFTRSPFTRGRGVVTAGSFDGSALRSATGGVDAGGTAIAASDTFVAVELKVGRDGVVGNNDNEYLYGCIKSFALWDRALTAAQLSEITGRGLADNNKRWADNIQIARKHEFLCRTSALNTPAENAALLQAVAAEAYREAGNSAVVLVMPGAFHTVGNIGGIRKLKGVGSGTMDFSGRGTQSGSLITASGVSNGAVPLNLNANRLDTSIRVTNANAAMLNLEVGKWLRVLSDATETGDTPETLASLGEWVQVDAIEVVSGNTIIHLNRPLVFSYVSSLNRRVLRDETIKPFTYEDLEIIGTGNQHVTVGNLTSGDNGVAVVLCERAEWNNVRVRNSERNAIRSSVNVYGQTQDCQTFHSRPHNNAQIQYGVAASGACREFQNINLRGSRGRHLVDYTGTPDGGAFERAVEVRCVADGCYSDGFAEHNSLLERISTDCVARFCGDGWHYRGRGRRLNKNPVVQSTRLVTTVTGGGANAAGPDAAFVLSRFAGDVEIIGMSVADTGYVLRAQHEGTQLNFNYNGEAPERIKFTGGTARQITRGFIVEHQGGLAGASNSYSTKETGPYHIIGVDMEMSPRPGGTTSGNPFYFAGYVNRAVLEEVSVEFPSKESAGWAALFYGVSEVVIEGLTAKHSTGIVHTSISVLNGAGASVTRQPGVLDIRSAPTLIDHQGDRLVLFGGTGGEYRAPPPTQLFVGAGPANHSGTMAETTLLTIPVSGGRMGPNGSLLIENLVFIGNNGGSNRTYRVKVNETTIWLLTTANSGVRVLPLHLVNQNNVLSQALFLGAEGAGSSANLSTFEINTGGDFDVEITCQLTDSGDTARVRSARAMLYQR